MHRKVPVRFGPGAARKRACTTGTSPAAYRCFFVLEACGLAVQLVNAAQAKSLPGRPKTDKLDAQWLARLTEMGLLRASFVPPKAIRDLRDYTRARARLTQERDEALLRETANAEILRLIAKSSGDLELLFRTILENATRICNANFGTLFRFW